MSLKSKVREIRGRISCWFGIHDWIYHQHKKTGFYFKRCRRCPAERRGNIKRLSGGDILAFRSHGFIARVWEKLFGGQG